ncbi:MAG: Holliday junction branch migration protein RuvA [Actinomycetota bacterium]|nr:Holliday junction branch migration protein RuvA [Actinomycetota bacterium]
MISRLRGRPVAVRPDGDLVLDVGGVGYRIHATRAALRRAEGAEEVAIETHLHVREDALALYGFNDPEERELFEHLLAVNGIGPKVALSIVSGSAPAELRRAVVHEDVARFQAIPGIGRKTAQRVVLELKEKLVPTEEVAMSTAASGAPHVIAREALVELGYSVSEAEQALAGTNPDLPPEERVREALKAA